MDEIELVSRDLKVALQTLSTWVACARKGELAGRVTHTLNTAALEAEVKRFKYAPNSNHNKPIAPNLLGQQFTVGRPNQVWSSDITYVWTSEGWGYVAGVA